MGASRRVHSASGQSRSQLISDLLCSLALFSTAELNAPKAEQEVQRRLEAGISDTVEDLNGGKRSAIAAHTLSIVHRQSRECRCRCRCWYCGATEQIYTGRRTDAKLMTDLAVR